MNFCSQISFRSSGIQFPISCLRFGQCLSGNNCCVWVEEWAMYHKWNSRRIKWGLEVTQTENYSSVLLQMRDLWICRDDYQVICIQTGGLELKILFTANSSGCSRWDLDFETQFGNINISSVTTHSPRNLCSIKTLNANQTCFQSPLGCGEGKAQTFYKDQIPAHALSVQKMDQVFLPFCSLLFSIGLHLCFVIAKLFPSNEPALKR